MAEKQQTETPSERSQVDLGNYEIIRNRLLAQSRELSSRAEALNSKRKSSFGGIEMSVIGNGSERVRTDHNCVPRDMVNVSGRLLFGYNVYMGLKSEISLSDIFSLHDFNAVESGFELPAVELSSNPTFLTDERFLRAFTELRTYYKDSTLQQLRVNESRLLAIFQTGTLSTDVKVFRWKFDDHGQAVYDDEGSLRDHSFPPSHDFEWIQTTAEQHVRGRHPHINILDEVFVETVGGDLTIKVEDNTDSGEGIYAEPVDDANQSLDDGSFFYAKVGTLILLKITPYREQKPRYFVFNTRRKEAVRLDQIGLACVQLPEDHGVVFPGGYYLQTGDYKVFENKVADLIFKRAIRAPNGEDVLYVFYSLTEGVYVLYPYNLVRKEVANPIYCNGFSLFDDGRLAVFRASREPSRVHPIQIWQTPFVSAEFAATSSTDGSALSKIGNADLVRGISDCFTVSRLVEGAEPTRKIFEDLISTTQRIVDAYFWLGQKDAGDLRSVLLEIRQTAELIIDEFEKVQVLKRAAKDALDKAKEKQRELLRGLMPEKWERIERFLDSMSELRNQRGHLISLKEMRYAELAAIDALEKETVDRFDLVGAACVKFLLAGQAFAPLVADLDKILEELDKLDKAVRINPLVERLDKLAVGLNMLVEVVGSLQVEDTTQRTQILEQVSEIFSHLNRVRATVQGRRKTLMTHEGKADFIAQFKLFGQAVSSSLSLCDTPEKCDEELSRVMVQLEDLEGRFSEFDDFLGELATKRDEVYEAFGGRKQVLVDERNRRIQNLMSAGERILQGVARRSIKFKNEDELNAYFASDPMIHKLRQLQEQLGALGDAVKADELSARLKGARQDGLRALRDRSELFEEGEAIIKLGQHRFSVNTQPLDLTMVLREVEGTPQMCLALTGTDYYHVVEDQSFLQTQRFWEQTLVSESPKIYRSEYLAARLLFDADAGRQGLSMQSLKDTCLDHAALLALVRQRATESYDEGYERGVHDADAALILEKLVAMRLSAGLLRFDPRVRALASLYWAFCEDADEKLRLHRKAASLGRLRQAFGQSAALESFARSREAQCAAFLQRNQLEYTPSELSLCTRYLVEELLVERPRFVTSADAMRLRDALYQQLERSNSRSAFEEDLRALDKDLAARFGLLESWFAALVQSNEDLRPLTPLVSEAACILCTERKLDRELSQASLAVEVQGLLGVHPRVVDGKISLRLDDFVSRLSSYAQEHVPAYRDYRTRRAALLDDAKKELRLDEFRPKVMSAFVRNKLINDVYLPLIGNNLAKQIGAAGDSKRTDLMGMLLLISPPGYGKTTLMEYVANRLGLVFVKVNGPALGHGVVSLDPNEAPNATARQEVEKVNLGFEMGNNVMLYLDDIQHTNPEFLQKFISLCDAQRKIEGVWRGRTRTYDFRGKKFCVVMAGNPYTEAGEKFQIPDMLANRADIYNLGDILSGKEDSFALSFIENALTSNTILAPLATREYADVYKLIRMAKGEEVPASDLSYAYSGVELGEIISIFKKLMVAQEVLLKVNRAYIESASMDERFRVEPRFQLQGSYRNMNKLAEKLVPAMNELELAQCIADHYVGEAQTLTSGAEANLLKLGELRGTLSPEQLERWQQIKRDFRRIKTMGGAADDPVARVTGSIGSVGEQLSLIQESLSKAVGDLAERDAERWSPVGQGLQAIDGSLRQLAAPRPNTLAPLLAKFEETLRTLNAPKPDPSAPLLQRLDATLQTLGTAQTRSQQDQNALAQLGGILDVLQDQLQATKQARNEEMQALLQRFEETLGLLSSQQGAGLEPALLKLDESMRLIASTKDQALAATLQRMEQVLLKLAVPRDKELSKALQSLSTTLSELTAPKVAVELSTPPGFENILIQQISMVERTLVPMVQTLVNHLAQGQQVSAKIEQILNALSAVESQLRDAGWNEALTATTRMQAIEFDEEHGKGRREEGTSSERKKR
ncbi:MAG: DNA repair ATPase [Myxococcota bacterium]|jgi:MoxR-like ATPase|nr:DNA repair ATPase [Myxococcota bacterium]